MPRPRSGIKQQLKMLTIISLLHTKFLEVNIYYFIIIYFIIVYMPIYNNVLIKMKGSGVGQTWFGTEDIC